MYCSYREPEFSSQHPSQASHDSVTPAQGIQCPFLSFVDTAVMCTNTHTDVHTCTQLKIKHCLRLSMLGHKKFEKSNMHRGSEDLLNRMTWDDPRMLPCWGPEGSMVSGGCSWGTELLSSQGPSVVRWQEWTLRQHRKPMATIGANSSKFIKIWPFQIGCYRMCCPRQRPEREAGPCLKILSRDIQRSDGSGVLWEAELQSLVIVPAQAL